MSGPLDLSMGSPIAKSLQDLIQAKLVERRYTTADDSSQFAEFITVMISNGKNRQQVSAELGDLIGPEFDPEFTEWIFKQLELLQNPPSNGASRDETSNSDQMDMDVTPGTKPSRGPARTNPYPAPRFFNQITKSMERSTSSDRRRRSPPNISSNLGGNTVIPTGPRAMREEQQNGHRNIRRYNNQGPLRGPMGNAKPPYANIPPHLENGFLVNPNFGRNLHERMGLPNPDENLTVVTPKPRCRHWPTCQLGASCKFSHPSQLCQKFPNCPNMSGTCPDIHPDDHILQQPPSNFQIPFNSNPFPQMNQFSPGHFQPPYPPFQAKASFIAPVAEHSQKELKGDSPVCKFADKCTKADCQFAHPTPAAEPGKGLILREERCEAGKHCTNPECDKVHPSPAVPTETSTNSPETCKFFPNCKNPSCTFKHEATKVPVLCRNGENCTRPDCHFIHPIPVKCRFGARCTNEICHFQHPERAAGTSRNKVWRAEDHVSERQFAAPDSTEAFAVIKDEVMVE